MNDKVTLIIPTYNEVDGLRQIMPRVSPDWYDQIIIVDGNSTDGTVEFARSLGYQVHIQKSFGLKNAYLEAFELVENDIVVTFSPDGNSVPELIPQLVAKVREGYDHVVASRYKDQAKSDDDTVVTAFGNWMFTRLINLLHGSNFTDAMVMYRAFRRHLFYDLDLHRQKTYWPEKLFFTDVCIMPILSVRVAKRKIKSIDIPGDEPVRVGGVKKLQVIRWGFAYLTQVIWEKFFWK